MTGSSRGVQVKPRERAAQLAYNSVCDRENTEQHACVRSDWV